MDTTPVAALLRSLSAAASRRGLLTALAGGLLTALPLPLGIDEAAAKNNGKRKRKRKQQARRKKRKNGQQNPLPPPSPPPGPMVRVDATCARPPEDNGLSINNPDVRLAQTFTALASGLLVRAEMPISRDSDSTADYVLQLGTVDDGGVPTNTVLATTSVAGAALPVGSSTLSFTFASPASVVAGTQYALILSRPGSDDLLWRGHRGDTCAGRAFQSSNLTAPFQEPLPDLDFSFTTFVSS